MELFKVLHPSMFGLLTSKNRNIYVSSLFVLRKAFLQEYNIEKDKLVRQLTQNIEKQLMELDYESESINEKNVAREPKYLANFVIKRFEETGWIECEYSHDGGFKENVSIPPYSIKLLNTLYDIAYESESPYTIHLYNVYSGLYSSTTSKPDYLYISLINAIDELGKLESALKILAYDLKKRYRTIATLSNSNEILAEHFDDYHQRIVKLVLVPLKTKDSVSRFKGAIIEILINWLRNPELMRLSAEQAHYSGQYESKSAGQMACRSIIDRIVERLEDAEALLDDIDVRNNIYISSVTQKLKYMLNANKSTKKRLTSILTSFKAKNPTGEKWLDQISDILAMEKQSYFDSNSLFIRAAGERAEYSEPLEIDTITDIVDEGDFVEEALNSPYTSRNILSYLEKLMEGKNELNIKDWPDLDTREMIIAVNSTIRGFDQNVFYKTEINNEERIINNSYEVPNTTFIRRRKL